MILLKGHQDISNCVSGNKIGCFKRGSETNSSCICVDKKTDIFDERSPTVFVASNVDVFNKTVRTPQGYLWQSEHVF